MKVYLELTVREYKRIMDNLALYKKLNLGAEDPDPRNLYVIQAEIVQASAINKLSDYMLKGKTVIICEVKSITVEKHRWSVLEVRWNKEKMEYTVL